MSSVVVAGSFIAFPDGFPRQVKADIINSTLFAQLASDKRYDRVTQPTEWYDSYKSVLETIGWIVQRFDFSNLSNVNSYGSVDNVVVETSKTSLDSQEQALFKKTIQASKESKNSSAAKIFDNSAKFSQKANFQAAAASFNDHNGVLKLAAYSYTTSQDIDSALFYKFGSQKTELFTASQSMVLNGQVYSTIRQAVEDKLGELARDRVEEIQL